VIGHGKAGASGCTSIHSRAAFHTIEHVIVKTEDSLVEDIHI